MGNARIGSYEAKTRLPELLRQVQAGHRFTITLRGEPVAYLVPTKQEGPSERLEASRAMQGFPRIQGVEADEVAKLVAEGRR
jgi:prevent-host-death family protein